VLAGADADAHVLEVPPGDDVSLTPEELAALAGGVSSPAAPDAPDGQQGAVFVLGSAFGSPGGAPMVRELVLGRGGSLVRLGFGQPQAHVRDGRVRPVMLACHDRQMWQALALAAYALAALLHYMRLRAMPGEHRQGQNPRAGATGHHTGPLCARARHSGASACVM
jgi:hypothetical protein